MICFFKHLSSSDQLHLLNSGKVKIFICSWLKPSLPLSRVSQSCSDSHISIHDYLRNYSQFGSMWIGNLVKWSPELREKFLWRHWVVYLLFFAVKDAFQKVIAAPRSTATSHQGCWWFLCWEEKNDLARKLRARFTTAAATLPPLTNAKWFDNGI